MGPGSLLKLELANLDRVTGRQATETYSLMLKERLELKAASCGFYLETRDLNSGPQTCTANTLLTMRSPQNPYLHLFTCHYPLLLNFFHSFPSELGLCLCYLCCSLLSFTFK